ncbi:MAG: polysaccharide deacetylase family protein [Clostridia bacterium]|nr:polysaccharide deacetylase family protein [Clostridia bacterium]
MEKAHGLSRFEKGTVVISIDDGNADDFRLYENVLLKYNLPATFNIISKAIDGETGLTKDQLRAIYHNPMMEIAAHGYTHQNDDEDITKGVAELYDWLGITTELIGFASPGSQMKNEFIEKNGDHLKALGLLYVRTSRNPDASNRHLEIQNELKTAGASDYVISNIPQLTYAFHSLCVNSAVVHHDTDIDDLKKLVDIASEERACIVFMFHRTKKKGELNYDELYCYDYDKFMEFAEYLAKKREEGVIEILTNRQAFLAAFSDTEASV